MLKYQINYSGIQKSSLSQNCTNDIMHIQTMKIKRNIKEYVTMSEEQFEQIIVLALEAKRLKDLTNYYSSDSHQTACTHSRKTAVRIQTDVTKKLSDLSTDIERTQKLLESTTASLAKLNFETDGSDQYKTTKLLLKRKIQQCRLTISRRQRQLENLENGEPDASHARPSIRQRSHAVLITANTDAASKAFDLFIQAFNQAFLNSNPGCDAVATEIGQWVFAQATRQQDFTATIRRLVASKCGIAVASTCVSGLSV